MPVPQALSLTDNAMSESLVAFVGILSALEYTILGFNNFALCRHEVFALTLNRHEYGERQSTMQLTGLMHRSVGRIVAHIALLILMALLLAALTVWGALAIYFGDSHTSTVQTALAVVFGLTGMVAMGGVFSPRSRRRLVGGYLMLFIVLLVWWFNIEPSNDRQWQADVAELPYASVEGDLVTVYNIRNFDYQSEFEYTPVYYSKTYDLSKLDSVDLYAIYWAGPAIAHMIVSFGFSGQDYLAVSIEARKELGEGYSSIKGFFRQYELIYIMADERDVIRLRTNYRNNPPEDVYRFRLLGSPEIAREFFLEYIKSINEQKDHPSFYNTLTANCTNMIWVHSHVNPNRIPFSWKVLVSGYGPEYLYDLGRLDTSVSFDELKRRGYVNPVARALGNAPDFSRRIRAPQASPGQTIP